MLRQLAAVTATGDRRARLQKITAPTLVIHGEDDPLVPVQGGEDTAANILGAKLKIIPGMGHDLPVELHEEIVAAIADLAQRI
jgi:pimeloyl-ACP methyl ester carboxylesterase